MADRLKTASCSATQSIPVHGCVILVRVRPHLNSAIIFEIYERKAICVNVECNLRSNHVIEMAIVWKQRKKSSSSHWTDFPTQRGMSIFYMRCLCALTAAIKATLTIQSKYSGFVHIEFAKNRQRRQQYNTHMMQHKPHERANNDPIQMIYGQSTNLMLAGNRGRGGTTAGAFHRGWNLWFMGLHIIYKLRYYLSSWHKQNAGR